jgi:prolyl oligopeptidase
MAARLQDASTSGRPVLLRVDFEGGHAAAAGRRQREEEIADIYSFLLWQFGLPEFQPPAATQTAGASAATPPAEGVTRAAFIPGTSAPSAASDATIQTR